MVGQLFKGRGWRGGRGGGSKGRRGRWGTLTKPKRGGGVIFVHGGPVVDLLEAGRDVLGGAGGRHWRLRRLCPPVLRSSV